MSESSGVSRPGGRAPVWQAQIQAALVRSVEASDDAPGGQMTAPLYEVINYCIGYKGGVA